MRLLHRPPLTDVLDEHCQELGFLRVQRRAVVFSPDARLRHVATVESRIGAHKAALEVAGTTCLARAERQAERATNRTRDPFQLAAALEVIVERSTSPALSIWTRLAASPEWSLPAWSESLRRAAPASVARAIEAARPLGDHPRVLEAVADAKSLGVRPDLSRPEGWELGRVRWAHARGLARGPHGDPGVEAALAALLDDDDPQVRRAALWSTALRSPDDARALAIARIEDPFSVRVLGALGVLADVERVALALEPETTRAAAVVALGELGHVAAASLLVAIARKPGLLGALATRALERLVGTSPEVTELGDAACRADRVHACEARAVGLDDSVRWLRGVPADDVGSASSMEALWVAAVRTPVVRSGLFELLRHEAPTRFFEAELCDHVEPGDGTWSS